MKKIKKKRFSIIKPLCNFLILIAPVIITETACVYFWGEPELPKELKNEIEQSN